MRAFQTLTFSHQIALQRKKTRELRNPAYFWCFDREKVSSEKKETKAAFMNLVKIFVHMLR